MHADYEDDIFKLPDGQEPTPNNFFWHAFEVIKDRWPEAEPTIMQDPGGACYYAEYVIGGRWPEAEPYIIEDPVWACYYAKYTIKGRWPEAEPTIRENEREWRVYRKRFGISK